MIKTELENAQSGVEVIVKPEATILDATAANRMIWQKKESPYILWIDVENELELPPDRIMDCTSTDLEDNSLNAIFFDPPHDWGHAHGKRWFTIKNHNELKIFNEKYGMERGLAYYGLDKFKSKSDLLSFVHKAQKEFLRLLKKDGMLWLKWNELRMPLRKILPFFRDWNEMMRLFIGSPSQTAGTGQTYWVMFMKKQTTTKILDLADFTNNEGSK